MASKIPDPVVDLGVEDTSSIDNDIDNLYKKFIIPIDNIRSIALPPVGILKMSPQNTPDSTINTVRPAESRAHAFYRFLGLPVVGGSSFYNPGFDPTGKSTDKRVEINGKVDNSKSQERETHLIFMQTLFGRQDIAASFMALVMARIPKPFNQELFNVPSRSAFVLFFASKYSSITEAFKSAASIMATSKVGALFSGGLHRLKPLQTDPAFELTVMPYDNKICVPFLPTKESTKISSAPQKYLLRPGIEYILRVRLSDTAPDKLFLNELQNVLTDVKKGNPTSAIDLKSQTLIATLTALADKNDINNIDINKIFSGFGATQTSITEQLIKTIKILVDELIESYSVIDEISEKITFLPLPPIEGPEKIGKVREIGGLSSLESTITQLEIKKLNSDRGIDLNTDDIGSFATPFVNLEKTTTYEEQIEEKGQLKNNLVSRGLKALRNIEIITGEVSGLGLIDILAIYTALWTIKLEELIGLFDDDSIDRLTQNNPALSASAVSSKTSISDATTALETRLDNILSFIDLLVTTKFNSPILGEGGEP